MISTYIYIIYIYIYIYIYKYIIYKDNIYIDILFLLVKKNIINHG